MGGLVFTALRRGDENKCSFSFSLTCLFLLLVLSPSSFRLHAGRFTRLVDHISQSCFRYCFWSSPRASLRRFAGIVCRFFDVIHVGKLHYILLIEPHGIGRPRGVVLKDLPIPVHTVPFHTVHNVNRVNRNREPNVKRNCSTASTLFTCVIQNPGRRYNGDEKPRTN